MHIEQALVLQDTGSASAIVRAIAGYVHADLDRERSRRPRGRDAHGTPADPTTVLAEASSSSNCLAKDAAGHRRQPSCEIEVAPG